MLGLAADTPDIFATDDRSRLTGADDQVVQVQKVVDEEASEPILPAPRAPSLRAEFSLGYGQGAYDGRIDFHAFGEPVEVESDSATGGVGTTLSLGLWADDWLAENVAIGLEYWHLRQRATAKARLPEGASTLSDPISGKADAELEADLLMLNAAAILGDRLRWHYLIGGGLGVARGEVNFSASLETPLVGREGVDERVRFIVPAAQLFLGAIFDVADPVYLTGQTHLLGGTGKPFGERQEFLDLVVSLGVGMRM